MTTRSRTRGRQLIDLPTVPIKQYNIWTTCSETAEVNVSNTATLGYGSFDRFSDEVIPDFHNRKNAGEIFFNPMSQILETRDGIRGIGMNRQSGTPNAPCGQRPRIRYDISFVERTVAVHAGGVITDPVYVNPLSLFDSGEIDDLLVEHSTKVLSQRGREGHDLFEALAEADKTMSLLPGLLGNIRKIVPPKNKLPSRVKSLASAWLGIRYGLMPLIRDVDNVMEGLKKPTGPLRRTTRSNSGDLRRTFTDVWTHNYGTLQHMIGTQSSDTVSVRCMSLDEYDITMLNNIGFSGKNLLTLPWELIPYSFVVDWISNIGDFIGAIAPSPGVRQLGTAVTFRRERITEFTQLGAFASGGWTILSQGSGSYKPTLTLRNRATTLPNPRVVIRNDFRFKNITRALDATSLLLQKIR